MMWQKRFDEFLKVSTAIVFLFTFFWVRDDCSPRGFFRLFGYQSSHIQCNV